MSADALVVYGWIWFSFPPSISLFLFLAFAFLVVHAGRHMVERTALMLEASERKVMIARTSLCIGSLVWALDVAGLFLYPHITAMNARFGPAMTALVLMVGSSRLTVPALTTTIRLWKVMLSAVGLAFGMMLAHMTLMTSIGNWVGTVRWTAIGMSLLLAILISAGLSVRHRWAQIKAAKQEFWELSWREELIASAGILFLHLCLVNVFVIESNAQPAAVSGFLVPLILVLFGIVISLDQLFASKVEDRRQEAMNRAMALVRSIHPVPAENCKHQIALIAERLSHLLGTGCMMLHFQPICPIQGQKEGIRFEALLRVRDKDLGIINPETFFLACERAGRTSWADRIVIEHALSASSPWMRYRKECVGISVNVAPDTLLEPGFVPWLHALLEQKGIPPGWLQLEITEHAMVSQARLLTDILGRLRMHGIAAVMDDFGAGFSSLTALADLPIYGIKCDRAFLRGFRKNESRCIILRHICDMGAAMGLRVTIEGVETEADLDVVRDSGAGYAQGYLFAKEMPPDHATSWIEDHGKLAQFAAPADK